MRYDTVLRSLDTSNERCGFLYSGPAVQDERNAGEVMFQPRFEPVRLRGWPCGPPSHLYNGYRVFPGGKAAGPWR